MDYRERTEAKVGVAFQIADQYLSDKIPLEEAKNQLAGEMANIRPAQFESIKMKLGEKLRVADSQVITEKLLNLFQNYLPFPYSRLELGHPIRNYYEENRIVRSFLVRVDEMEGEEATVDTWKEIYERLSQFQIHIKRQEKNFYPLLLPAGMRLQIEKVKELGDAIIHEISNNQEILKSGDLFRFIFHQRSLTQIFMNYLDLEERVILPKALRSLTEETFTELKRSDDMDGYVYIDKPADFIPKDTPKIGVDHGMLLPAVLASREMGLVYYTLTGEIVSVLGEQITKEDLPITEGTRQAILNDSEKKLKYWYNKGNKRFLITYSLVMDHQKNRLGILKTKEDISEILALSRECLEGNQSDQTVKTDQDIIRAAKIIDTNQKISELFARYPKFQIDFYHLDEELMGLKGLMGAEILKEATVGMVAKSLRVDPAVLAAKINKLLDTY
jgi:DUF438 domain-containing protein